MSEQHVVLLMDPFEVLRYPSLASAKAMFMDKGSVYVCAQDFEDRLSMNVMSSVIRRLLKEKFRERDLPKSRPQMAEMVWRVSCKYATPHNPLAKRSGARAERRADARYRVAPSYGEFVGRRMPPQMRAMGVYFLAHMSPDGVDEEGVEMLVRAMHDEGLLTTRQDPVRIWRYYRADMLRRCLMELV